MLTTSRIALLSVALCGLLTGCAGKWYRPDTTQADFDRDRQDCIQEGYRTYPATMVQKTVGVGYQNPAQTNCYTSGGNTNCTTTGGNYVPPATVTQDVNQYNRNAAINSCLNARGYTYK